MTELREALSEWEKMKDKLPLNQAAYKQMIALAQEAINALLAERDKTLDTSD